MDFELEYKKSPLNKVISFEEFKNYLGFMSLKNLENEFKNK